MFFYSLIFFVYLMFFLLRFTIRFFDTFNLPRGDQNCESWRGKRGVIHINLAKKDGYTNMIPRYILDENGYVKKSNNLQPAAPMQQTQQVDYETVSMDELGDIPF